VLELEVLSNWGDRHYVGLAGLELFDERGRPITLTDPAGELLHSIVMPDAALACAVSG